MSKKITVVRGVAPFQSSGDGKIYINATELKLALFEAEITMNAFMQEMQRGTFQMRYLGEEDYVIEPRNTSHSSAGE